jgi:putative tricarboxylic transport membrane protein
MRDLCLGVGLVLLAVAVIWHVAGITVGFSYDILGPRAFPYIVSAGLVISGVALVVSAVKRPADAEPSEVHDWRPIVIISAALLLQLFLVSRLGWIPVATVAFLIVSMAFGNRRIGLGLLFGFLLAAGTFALFNFGLGLRLPVGTYIEAIFPPPPDGAPAP